MKKELALKRVPLKESEVLTECMEGSQSKVVGLDIKAVVSDKTLQLCDQLIKQSGGLPVQSRLPPGKCSAGTDALVGEMEDIGSGRIAEFARHRQRVPVAVTVDRVDVLNRMLWRRYDAIWLIREVIITCPAGAEWEVVQSSRAHLCKGHDVVSTARHCGPADA